jgi:pimeloyl-ACP methyl ester carboxylesterase
MEARMVHDRIRDVRTRAGAVTVRVTGEGPPLVLLHSVAHDHHDWDGVVPTLSKFCQTIAVDWPGHGGSEMWRPPSSASARGMCEALVDVIDALNFPTALFMGNSVGGTASVRLAALRPERVRGLVLVDSGGFGGPTALVRAACWVQGREFVRRWTGMWFARSYLKIPGPQVNATLERIEASRRRPGFIEMDAAMWRSFGRKESDVTDIAPTVSCPTLIVWGKRDPVVRSRVEGRRARACIPHAKYVELDTGHVPFVEDTSAFLGAVVPFLEPLLARAEPDGRPGPQVQDGPEAS